MGNGSKATVIARKVGKANVIARATDGSGKKAVVKVNVVKFVSDKTPAPTATPDTRKKTLVEDFRKLSCRNRVEIHFRRQELRYDESSTGSGRCF